LGNSRNFLAHTFGARISIFYDLRPVERLENHNYGILGRLEKNLIHGLFLKAYAACVVIFIDMSETTLERAAKAHIRESVCLQDFEADLI